MIWIFLGALVYVIAFLWLVGRYLNNLADYELHKQNEETRELHAACGQRWYPHELGNGKIAWYPVNDGNAVDL